MTTTLIAPTAGPSRRLYVVRAVAALVWAVVLVVALATVDEVSPDESLPALLVVLLALYPLIDVAASVLEVRGQRATASAGTAPHLVNAAIGVAAAAAVVVTATQGIDAVLRVFGAWAFLTGVIQLVLGVRRRAADLAGQWPIVVSGAISALVGLGFVFMASQDAPELTGTAGYAAAGAIFFLVSAWRQHSRRDLRGADQEG